MEPEGAREGDGGVDEGGARGGFCVDEREESGVGVGAADGDEGGDGGAKGGGELCEVCGCGV